MRNVLIGIGVAVAAAALGVGAAYGGSELLKGYARERIEAAGDGPVIVECEDEGPMPFFGRLPNRMRDSLWERMEEIRERRMEESNSEE